MLTFAIAFQLGNGIISIISFILIFLVCLLLRDILIGCKVIKPHRKRNYSKIKRTQISQHFNDIYEYIESKYGKELEKNRIKSIISTILFGLLFLMSIPLFLLLGGFLLENIGDIGILISGTLCFGISQGSLYYYYKCNTTYKKILKMML